MGPKSSHWPLSSSNPSLLRFREEKRRMRCLRMRIEVNTQLNFKKPLACCHGNRKVHPIAMATGKHGGLLLGLGIWEVAEGVGGGG